MGNEEGESKLKKKIGKDKGTRKLRKEKSTEENKIRLKVLAAK